jgi:cell division protein FtsA
MQNEELNFEGTFATSTVAPKKDENNQPIIVGLDIGTTKIVAIAGRKNEFGKLEIIGFGHAKSSGVQHGMVLNINQTISSIQATMEDCHKCNPELEIKEVYVGIAGHHIKSLKSNGDIVRKSNDDEITQVEIDQLISDQHKIYIPAGDQIIDIIPQEYKVDNHENIPNPIGFSGVRIGANFHIITGDKNAIRNITRSVMKSNLQVTDLVLQPLASAAAVMSDQDLEAGVAIVDIGGGTTDLAIFYEGILKHTAVIPFGGENITMDIKTGLGVLKAQAEAMKVQYGSALPDKAVTNAYIRVPSFRGLPPRDISVSVLAEIIQARMTEILEFVSFHIKQAGLDNRMLNGGIVLTGGGSQLKHLIQLTEYVTGFNARIGYPNEHLATGYTDELAQPMYSTCIGLILKGYNVYENSPQYLKGNVNQTKAEVKAVVETIPVVPEIIKEEVIVEEKVKNRSKLKNFMDTFKTGLIHMFTEEEDMTLK